MQCHDWGRLHYRVTSSAETAESTYDYVTEFSLSRHYWQVTVPSTCNTISEDGFTAAVSLHQLILSQRMVPSVYSVCHVQVLAAHWRRCQSPGELCGGPGGRPGLPVPNKPTVFMDVKQHFSKMQSLRAEELCQWKSRWPSWAPVPNKPTVSVDVKATLQRRRHCSHF